MYPIPKDGEWVQPVKKGYKMRCCDCGLVHRIDFRVLDWRTAKPMSYSKVQMRVERDNRATAASRRPRARAVPNAGVVAGPKPVMANQRSPGATRDRLSVSNNRRSERRNEQS